MSILTARPNTPGTGGEEKQTAYPLGSLVFGTLDVDWEPYLEQARALRRAYTGVDFGETCTMPQRLSEPETCVYYQVAEFYHNTPLSVRAVSPAFFDLLEGHPPGSTACSTTRKK